MTAELPPILDEPERNDFIKSIFSLNLIIRDRHELSIGEALPNVMQRYMKIFFHQPNLLESALNQAKYIEDRRKSYAA